MINKLDRTASKMRLRGVGRPSLGVRLARIVALAVIIGIGFSHVWWSITDWHLKDMNAYWDAGVRLRAGDALYPQIANVLASEVYRYSPWFAWLWAPLTVLPRELVNVLWSAVLLAASIAAVWPMARRGSWIAVAFFLPVLIGISAGGNVHALLIAALVLGIERPSGPVWIGVAASLKVFPILFALTYLGRRQWWRVIGTGAIAAILLAPYLLYDLTNYVTSAGGAALLSQWMPVYVMAVAASIAAALWYARSRHAWLASAVAVALALPRFFVYDITYLAVGLAEARDGTTSEPRPAHHRSPWGREPIRDVTDP